RVQDTRNGETTIGITELGAEQDLLGLVSRIGTRLRASLGTEQPNQQQELGIRASVPSNSEAARLYAEGLSRLRAFELVAARDILRRAAEADAKHALAHASLAVAWSALGYEHKAMDEARRALDLATSLAREDRLSV